MKGLNWLFIIIIIIIIIISSSSSSSSISSSSVLIASTFLLLHSTRYSKINIMYGCSYVHATACVYNQGCAVVLKIDTV